MRRCCFCAAASRSVVPPAIRGGHRRRLISTASSAGRHYAVVGAGLAGLATAYHLLALSDRRHPVHVTLVDAVGLGAGGSGAAAGLLHPFTPKGKLLWRAQEAMGAALELLEVAEAAAAQSSGLQGPIAWRTGMLRPASSAKQSQDYWRALAQRELPPPAAAPPPPPLPPQQQQQDGPAASLMKANVVDATAASRLVPGVMLPAAGEGSAVGVEQQLPPPPQQPQQQQQQQRRKQQERQRRALEGWSGQAAAALHIPGGVTLHPARYMRALWEACRLAAAARADGSGARLRIRRLRSLGELPAPEGGKRRLYDAVVVAAGAAVSSIAEVGGQLPLDLCQGYTLDMEPPPPPPPPQPAEAAEAARAGAAAAGAGSAGSYGAASPSLLGSPYLASQGGGVLVVGATKRHGLSGEQALAELGRRVGPPGEPGAAAAGCREGGERAGEAAEVAAATAELLAGAAAAWPPVARWRVAGVRTGVRALPPRTQLGSVPIAGRWPPPQQPEVEQQLEPGAQSARPPAMWLLVGLGARGLVYHAWLGQLVARAVLHDDEALLPDELLAWRRAAAPAAVGGLGPRDAR